MTLEQIARLGRKLTSFLALFANCFGRCDARMLLLVYVKGQLSNLHRKTAESIALHFKTAPRTLQRFLESIKWEEEKLRDRCRTGGGMGPPYFAEWCHPTLRCVGMAAECGGKEGVRFGFLVSCAGKTNKPNPTPCFLQIGRYKTLAGGSANEIATSTYTYDTLGRLSGLAYTKGGTNLFTPYSWTFDSLSQVGTAHRLPGLGVDPRFGGPVLGAGVPTIDLGNTAGFESLGRITQVKGGKGVRNPF